MRGRGEREGERQVLAHRFLFINFVPVENSDSPSDQLLIAYKEKRGVAFQDQTRLD